MMRLPVRTIKTRLPDTWKEGRSITIELSAADSSIVVSITDSMGIYTKQFSLPAVVVEDPLGPMAYLAVDTVALGFEWNAVVEPEYDLPFTEDEQPMWQGTDIHLRCITMNDKFYWEEVARKQLDIPRPLPVENFMVPPDHSLTLHFRTNGTFEHGSYSIIMKESPGV